MNYYNEFEPYSVAWLRNLKASGLIPAGHVDERSIVDVTGEDIGNAAQAHFFAGIGGWSRALELSGWPKDRPVWTGSCPCQPFSCAGKAGGVGDERHLWPAFLRLITECRPPVIFGEQVASPLGRKWLAGVRADLEKLGYAVGAADLCAAGVGAPHLRQRLYWVAHSGQAGLPIVGSRDDEARSDAPWNNPVGRGANGRMADANGGRCEQRDQSELAISIADQGRGVGHADEQGCSRESLRLMGAGGQDYWEAFDLLPCIDGKSRRVEPGTFPLAHGVPNRVGKLRAYGNAIVPQEAAAFIEAYLDTFHK